MDIFEKQPAEVLDYTFPLSKWMADGDAVTSSVATSLPVGLTTSVTNPATLSPSVWVSGGVDGVSYQITLTVVTTGGRTKEFEMTLKVDERVNH